MGQNKLHVIIDATQETSLLEVFHIPMWERCLRLAAVAGARNSTVFFSESTHRRMRLRKDFGVFHELRTSFEILTQPLSDAVHKLPLDEKMLIFMQGDTIYQDTLVQEVVRAEGELVFFDSTKSTVPIFKTSFKSVQSISNCSLSDIQNQLISERKISRRDISKMSAYVPSQRKEIRPYIFQLKSSSDVKPAERFIFEVTHYGSLDFVAKHTYKEISKSIVTWLCRFTVTPNQITYVSIVFAVAVVPLFFLGHIMLGTIFGFIVSLLDVFDGKLARFTYRMSDKGDALDHVADRLNILTYYLGFGFGLYTGGYTDSLTTASWLATLNFIGHYMDKSVVRTFKMRIGLRLDEHRQCDIWVRLIRPGRNILLCFITVGLCFHALVESFALYALLMYMVAFYHMIRLKMEWDKTPVFLFPVQDHALGALRERQ